MRKSKAVPIGRALLRAGLVTSEQLRQGLEDQRRDGGLLGQHLMLAGAVTRRDMYGVLAEQWRVPLIDLVAEPPDPDLVVGNARELIGRGWIPWRRDGDLLVVATSVPPTGEVLLNMRSMTGADTIVLRATTDWDVMQAVSGARRSELVHDAERRFDGNEIVQASRSDLALRRARLPLAVTGLLVAGFFVWPLLTISVLLATASSVYLLGIALIALASLRGGERVSGAAGAAHDEPDSGLPVYTVLVPVSSAQGDIGAHLATLSDLDYPKVKLELLLLVDEDDVLAFDHARALRPPEFVKILAVPRGVSRSAHRSCNYGLSFARGEFVVIFEVDETPDPQQLRRAVHAFRNGDQDAPSALRSRPLVCVQATPDYVNADQNVLTRLEAVEQAWWCDELLPWIDKWGIPLPLGGTSNHFVTQGLRDMGGWNPDGTDDHAELALRVASDSKRVAVIASRTRKTAGADLDTWLAARKRWIAASFVTTVANTRHPVRCVRRSGGAGALALGSLMVGTPLAFFAFPLSLLIAVTTFVGTVWMGLDLPGWMIVSLAVVLVAGNLLAIVLASLAAARRYGWRVAVSAALNPAYWCLQAFAAGAAAVELLTRPAPARSRDTV